MLPDPLAVHEDPGEAAQLQITLVRAEGTLSVTWAPVTGSGPLLRATIV